MQSQNALREPLTALKNIPQCSGSDGPRDQTHEEDDIVGEADANTTPSGDIAHGRHEDTTQQTGAMASVDIRTKICTDGESHTNDVGSHATEI